MDCVLRLETQHMLFHFQPHVMMSILIFSIMSPLGAFAGFTAQSLIEQNTLVTAILNALAAGTLLFVVFFEVSSHLHHRDQNLSPN